MKIAITGDRALDERGQEIVKDNFYQMLTDILSDKDVALVAGATGVDELVSDLCDEHNVQRVLFKPYHMLDNKAEFSPRMFLARNRQMVDNADKVVVFTRGEDGGMNNMIEYAKKKGKPLSVIAV